MYGAVYIQATLGLLASREQRLKASEHTVGWAPTHLIVITRGNGTYIGVLMSLEYIPNMPLLVGGGPTQNIQLYNPYIIPVPISFSIFLST